MHIKKASVYSSIDDLKFKYRPSWKNIWTIQYSPIYYITIDDDGHILLKMLFYL